MLADKSLQVMGILNLTPDSFSDGGQFTHYTTALKHAETMLKEGADIIDIGGESTRPGASEVSLEDELQRVIPVVEAIKKEFSVPVSVDTSKPDVMRAAINAGADMINDVRALQADGAIEVCAASDVAVCLMHMQGQPRTMQSNPHYNDVVTEVNNFLQERKSVCISAGIDESRIYLDPGFGFGKTLAHNLTLLARLQDLKTLKSPLLIGISRKSMLGALLDNAPVDQRLYASISAAVIAAMQGTAIIRVHDVKATVDALKVVAAVKEVQ
jgi:dihydropteroate synthase